MILARSIIGIYFFLAMVPCFSQGGLGLTGGFSYTHLRAFYKSDTTTVGSMGWKPSFHIGMHTRISLTKRLGLSIWTGFESKGSQSENVTYQLHYLTLSCKGQYRLSPNWYAEAGAETGMRISAQRKSRNNSGSWDMEKHLSNTFDVGLVLAIGYNISEQFFVTASYVHGLQDMSVDEQKYQPIHPDDPVVPKDRGLTYKNQSLQVSIGWNFLRF